MYIINDKLWSFLKIKYSSTVTLRKEASGAIMAKMKMDESDETYRPVAISNSSSIKAAPMLFKANPIQESEDDLSDISDDSDNSNNSPNEDPILGKRTTVGDWEAERYLDRPVSVNEIIVEESVNKSKEESEQQSMRQSQEFRRTILHTVNESSEEEEIWLGSQIAPAVGLKNYGSNCYVNAGLQCLLSLPEITGYFLGKEYDKISYETVVKTPSVCKKLSAFYQEVFEYFV